MKNIIKATIASYPAPPNYGHLHPDQSLVKTFNQAEKDRRDRRNQVIAANTEQSEITQPKVPAGRGTSYSTRGVRGGKV